ncbi:MAG: PAS domain-containing protein, partial [Jatrophihabitantaceae bacterium]
MSSHLLTGGIQHGRHDPEGARMMPEPSGLADPGTGYPDGALHSVSQHPGAFGRETPDLADIVDHLPAMISWWDGDERNRFANRAFVQWFGLTPSQVYGMHLESLLGPAAYTMNLAYIEGALAGEPQQFERVQRDGEATARQVQVCYTPRLVNGTLDGFYVLVVDITPRVQAELALLESTENVVRSRERERIAARLDDVVIRNLNAASLELSATLQPGSHDTSARIRSVLDLIDQVRRDVRGSI